MYSLGFFSTLVSAEQRAEYQKGSLEAENYKMKIQNIKAQIDKYKLQKNEGKKAKREKTNVQNVLTSRGKIQK